MSCNCLKRNENKTREAALRESEVEKADYVIYKQDGKIYYDRKTCWSKAGKPGHVLEYIYYTEL